MKLDEAFLRFKHRFPFLIALSFVAMLTSGVSGFQSVDRSGEDPAIRWLDNHRLAKALQGSGGVYLFPHGLLAPLKNPIPQAFGSRALWILLLSIAVNSLIKFALLLELFCHPSPTKHNPFSLDKTGAHHCSL